MTIEHDFEQMLLAACISYPQILDSVSFLDPEDFSDTENATIWRCVKELIKDGEKVNTISVHNALRGYMESGEVAEKYIHALYFDTFITTGIDYLALAKMLRSRRVEQEVIANAPVSKLKHLLTSLEVRRSKPKQLHLKQALTDWMRYVQEEKTDSINTTYKLFDYLTGGLNKSDLIVLAARPSVGKTTWALNASLNVAKQGKKTVFINLEMSVNSIVSKIMAIETLLNSNKFRDKHFEENEIKNILSAGQKLTDNTPELILVDAGSITIPDIRQILIDNKGTEFLVVDQLTKIRNLHKRERKDLDIADLTFGMKELAKEFNIPILLMHQLSRGVEGRTNKMPVLSDLRDGGSIEQDADIVAFLYRHSYYNNDDSDNRMAMLIAKNKMGGTGLLGYRYNRQNSVIWEVSKEEILKDFSDF